MTDRLPPIRSILIASASVLALAACATRTPPPVISYDSNDFKPAVIEKAPLKPVEIVEVPKVLPLPGQLQPEPGEAAEDKRPPTVRVDHGSHPATRSDGAPAAGSVTPHRRVWSAAPGWPP